MEFLSKTFQNLTGTSIPYTIKDLIWKNLVWELHDGINPKDNSPVSIFIFNGDTNQYKDLAQTAFSHAKLVKFPGIVTTIDFFEFGTKYYIVTEPVKPLSTIIRLVDKNIKVFGIHSIATSLEFLNSKCNLVHGNVTIDSIFISNDGNWKLFGFELINRVGEMAKNAVSYGRNLVDLPEELVNSQLCNYQSSAQTDSFLMGKFIQEYVSDWNSTAKRLTGKFGSRITIEEFLMKNDNLFSTNAIIRFNDDLNGIKVLRNEDKLGFFKYNLADYLEDPSIYPEGLISYKLLPELVNQYTLLTNFKPTVNTTAEETAQNQEILSIVLNFILKISSSLSTEEFTSKIIPIIKTSFNSNDRSIRLILLNNLAVYKDQLSNNDIQLIFPRLITGIQDSNFIIRELTLTSINSIVDSLSDKAINQDLLKVLAKCQNDPKPSIRTNTIILIIKISLKIYKNSRNNVVITALNKALKDSFTPCKMASLKGFESLNNEFSLDEVCTKILGILAAALMDHKSQKVRLESRRLFNLYLDKVETQAQTLGDEEDEELEEKQFMARYGQSDDLSKKPATANASGTGPGFGWNLMSKLVSSGEMNDDVNKSSSTVNLISNETRTTPVPTKSVEDLSIQDEWDDGWGGVEDEIESKPKPTPRAKPAARPIARKPATTRTKSSSLKLGHQQKSKTPGSTLKLNLVDDDEPDGWGGTDDW